MKYLLIFILSLSVLAEDIYVAQTSSGLDNGTSPANAHSAVWLNTSGNWGTGADKVSAGDTVHLCGTITTALVAQGSGSVGSPVTVLFEAGAKMSKASWSGNVFTLSGLSYITIDGGAIGKIGGYLANETLSNGLIESTDNGTGLGSQNTANGILGKDCDNIIIKNLMIRNLYVRQSGGDTGIGGSCVLIGWNGGPSPSNVTVTNCVFHNNAVGFSIDYGPGSQNFTFTESSAYNVNWGGNAGDHGATATMTSLVVSNCYFHDFVIWDNPDNSQHHNGFYAWAESGGTLNSVVMAGNTIGPNYSVGSPNNATAGLFVSGAGATGSVLIFNNLFIENTTGNAPANGLIFVWPGVGCVTKIYNNTFIGMLGGNAIAPYGANGASVFHVYNNICSNKTFISVAFNGNVMLNSDLNVGVNLSSGQEFSTSVNGSASFKTLVQWKALGFDTSSSSSNPLLNADYTMASNSPARMFGTNLTSVFNTDKAGYIREGVNTINWDVGAYKYILGPQFLRVR